MPLLQTSSLKSPDAFFLVTVFCTTLLLVSKEGNGLNHTEIGGLIVYSSLRNIWAYRTVNWPIKTQLLNQSGEKGGCHTCSELVTNTQWFLLWTEYVDLRAKGLKVVELLFSIVSKFASCSFHFWLYWFRGLSTQRMSVTTLRQNKGSTELKVKTHLTILCSL